MLDTATRVHIRWMIRRDMSEVLAIAQSGACPFQEEEDFLAFLRQRNVIGMVAERGEHVLGFILYELHEHYIQVKAIAVDPKLQRQGIGRVMVDKLKGKLSAHRRRSVTAALSERLDDAHLFLKACGFEARRVLRDFVDDGHDAYLFQFTAPPEQTPEGD